MTFRLPTSGPGRKLSLLLSLVFLGVGIAGSISIARQDPQAAAPFALVMALSSGFFFSLYRAMGQGLVYVDGLGLRLEMGYLLRAFIPMELVQGAQKLYRVPFNLGSFGAGFLNYGVHTDFRGNLEVLLGPGPVVELSLARPSPARMMGLPLKVKRVRLSLEEPELFLTSIGSFQGKGR